MHIPWIRASGWIRGVPVPHTKCEHQLVRRLTIEARIQL
jgi:hypothetical protein